MTYPVLSTAVLLALVADSITFRTAPIFSELSVEYGTNRLTSVPLISTPGAFEVVDVGTAAAAAKPPKRKHAATAAQVALNARFTIPTP